MRTKGAFQKIINVSALAALIVLLFALFSCKTEKEPVAVVEAKLMNVMYKGISNPLFIAVSGYPKSAIEVSIDNGTIEGSAGEYNVILQTLDEAKITVSIDGKEIRTIQFRVKPLPDPVPGFFYTRSGFLVGRYYGDIKVEDLLTAGKVLVDLPNLDFVASFNVTSFTMFASDPKSKVLWEKSSESNEFTEEQTELIKTLKPGQILTIQDIMAIAPDGAERELKSMEFKIIE